MGDPKKTLHMPDPGHEYIRHTYNAKSDTMTVQYRQKEGFFPQVLVDTGIPLPKQTTTVKYEPLEKRLG